MVDFQLGLPPLDRLLSPLRAGSNLLVTGPPLSGADSLVHAILRTGLLQGEGALLVSTGLTGEDCLEALKRHGADPVIAPGPLGVVDCLSQTIGLNAQDTEFIKRVSSPVNMTGIAVAATTFLQEFWVKRRARKMRFVIHNVSTMLLYSDLKSVFRFLHVFCGRMKAARGLGIYVVEGKSDDEETLPFLKQLVDGVIELKAEEGGRFMRAVGPPGATPWVPYSVEAGRIVALQKGGELERRPEPAPTARR